MEGQKMQPWHQVNYSLEQAESNCERNYDRLFSLLLGPNYTCIPVFHLCRVGFYFSFFSSSFFSLSLLLVNDNGFKWDFHLTLCKCLSLFLSSSLSFYFTLVKQQTICWLLHCFIRPLLPFEKRERERTMNLFTAWGVFTFKHSKMVLLVILKFKIIH